MNMDAANLDRVAQAADDMLGNVGHAFAAALAEGEDDGELVGADPGAERVRGNGVDDRIGDRPQDGISGNVAIDVVDVLEPIEVDDEHRHLLAVAARFADDAVADLVDRAEGRAGW